MASLLQEGNLVRLICQTPKIRVIRGMPTGIHTVDLVQSAKIRDSDRNLTKLLSN